MKNNTLWLDDNGLPIQAHGGCIIEFDNRFYWYGEHKGAENVPGKTQVPFIGISCYSSEDLKSWHYEGLMIKADQTDEQSELHPSRVCERPKVIYNAATKKYVMWFHLDREDYSYAKTGVAVSDNPAGPFTYLGVRHANYKDSRDMTLYCDGDGVAYLVHSSDWNKTLYFSRLTDDYTDFTGFYTKALIDQEREAPALFYKNGLYYLISSGCTGWQPNSALYAVSRHLLSGWKLVDNPCTGIDSRKTFYAQSTFVFTIKGQEYLLLDHWKPENLKESGYSILPIHTDGDYMEIPWQEDFNS